LFPTNTIGKPRGVWSTLISFPRAHAFQGNGLGLVYRHALASWDELSPEERERAMGFQTGTTTHTKGTKLERNALLGKGMDLNSFTWLLVSYVFFQMYTTPALVQLAWSLVMRLHGTPTKYTYLFSTLYTSLLVLGGGGTM
jgi:hypothetical protein